ncbi:DUF1697 domain-containing protein [Phenylobacterium sp.]|uniref:DUF1697 domain-containing protein n=1 Tax=Phenylobacterium sp. TaxID=1871053 RepID=UPI0035B35F89
MSARIALFRAVNVGGSGKVAMSDLKALFDDLGLGPAATLQAAGSVVFHGQGEEADLEARLEAEAAARLGLKSAVFVRGPEEWRAVIAANPFAEAARDEPSRLMVMPLKAPADPAGPAALEAAGQAGERVAATGRSAYIHFPQGAGTSKLTPRLIEARLGAPGTARNWNTVLKLMAMLGG